MHTYISFSNSWYYHFFTPDNLLNKSFVKKEMSNSKLNKNMHVVSKNGPFFRQGKLSKWTVSNKKFPDGIYRKA